MSVIQEIDTIEQAICQGHATMEQMLRIVQIARSGVASYVPEECEFIDIGKSLDPAPPTQSEN